MNEKSEIEKALCNTLAAIAKREKEKAIQKDDYGNALIASFIEGLFKEAERSFEWLSFNENLTRHKTRSFWIKLEQHSC